jgi:Na+-driven multidrug efflux pump
MICLSGYILADTFFIARALGANGLTALNFCISIFSIIYGFGLMIGIGGATQYAILKNKGEDTAADSIFTHSLFIGLLLAIIFVFVGVFFSTPLSRILGADAVTLPLAKIYMKTMLCYSPVLLLSNILGAFIRNDNNPKLAMAGMFVFSFSNIVLDYIFMFPLSMGMFGAALATGLALVLSVCVLSLHFFMVGAGLKPALTSCKISIAKTVKIMCLGASAFVNELSFAFALITFNLIILGIEGNLGVAAYGIVVNIAIIAISIFTGVAQGVQPMLSRGYGIGDNLLVRKTLKYAIITVFLSAFFIYGIVYFNSANIVSLFNREANTALAMLAETGLKVYFIGLFFAGINIVMSAFFSAVNNAKTGFLISVLRSCVIIIPMVIFLSAVLKMNGVWLSFVVTELIVCVLSAVFFVYALCKR